MKEQYVEVSVKKIELLRLMLLSVIKELDKILEMDKQQNEKT